MGECPSHMMVETFINMLKFDKIYLNIRIHVHVAAQLEK